MSFGPMRVARVPAQLFTTTVSGVIVPAPISTAGTFNSGIIMTSGAGFEHAAFQMVSPTQVAVTGFSAQIFGTLDPYVLLNNDGFAGTQGGIGSKPNPSYPIPGAAGGAWVPVPAPSEQSGGGGTSVVNPLTAINQLLETKVPFLAFFVQVTATAPTGSINVVGWAID